MAPGPEAPPPLPYALPPEVQLAAFAAACSPDGAGDGKGTTSAAAPADSAGNDGADAVAASQGREYTRWFYDREFDKLWAKFSPEMRRTFATPAELATLAGRTVEGEPLEMLLWTAGRRDVVVLEHGLVVQAEPVEASTVIEYHISTTEA